MSLPLVAPLVTSLIGKGLGALGGFLFGRGKSGTQKAYEQGYQELLKLGVPPEEAKLRLPKYLAVKGYIAPKEGRPELTKSAYEQLQEDQEGQAQFQQRLADLENQDRGIEIDAELQKNRARTQALTRGALENIKQRQGVGGGAALALELKARQAQADATALAEAEAAAGKSKLKASTTKQGLDLRAQQARDIYSRAAKRTEGLDTHSRFGTKLISDTKARDTDRELRQLQDDFKERQREADANLKQGTLMALNEQGRKNRNYDRQADYLTKKVNLAAKAKGAKDQKKASQWGAVQKGFEGGGKAASQIYNYVQDRDTNDEKSSLDALKKWEKRRFTS